MTRSVAGFPALVRAHNTTAIRSLADPCGKKLCVNADIERTPEKRFLQRRQRVLRLVIDDSLESLNDYTRGTCQRCRGFLHICCNMLRFQLVAHVRMRMRYCFDGDEIGGRSILMDKVCIRLALARSVGMDVGPGKVETGEVFAEAVGVVGGLLFLAGGGE
jgi:hypothetical protein